LNSNARREICWLVSEVKIPHPPRRILEFDTFYPMTEQQLGPYLSRNIFNDVVRTGFERLMLKNKIVADAP
jgi:hypothetical protein